MYIIYIYILYSNTNNKCDFCSGLYQNEKLNIYGHICFLISYSINYHNMQLHFSVTNINLSILV